MENYYEAPHGGDTELRSHNDTHTQIECRRFAQQVREKERYREFSNRIFKQIK